jgi:hypothetical protein
MYWMPKILLRSIQFLLNSPGRCTSMCAALRRCGTGTKQRQSLPGSVVANRLLHCWFQQFADMATLKSFNLHFCIRGRRSTPLSSPSEHSSSTSSHLHHPPSTSSFIKKTISLPLFDTVTPSYTMISTAEGIAYSELVVYIPIFLLTAIIIFRHGFQKQLGWIYLTIFCVVRIAGAIFEIKREQSPTNKTDIEWAEILQSVGLSPLLMASLGLLKRVSVTLPAFKR